MTTIEHELSTLDLVEILHRRTEAHGADVAEPLVRLERIEDGKVLYAPLHKYKVQVVAMGDSEHRAAARRIEEDLARKRKALREANARREAARAVEGSDPFADPDSKASAPVTPEDCAHNEKIFEEYRQSLPADMR